MLRRIILHALLSNINSAKDFGVLRLQTVQNFMKASAHSVLGFRRFLAGGFQLTRPCFECSVPRSVPPITINHGITEQAVEPSHRRFVRAEIIPMLKRAEIGGLQNVLG
jgi:hypothetical protein